MDRPADIEGPDPEQTDNGPRPDDLALDFDLEQDPAIEYEDGEPDDGE